jgi:hypothetical protein
MRLVDATGRELAKADEPCDICTVREADEAIARAAGKLAAAARTLPTEPPPPPKAETAPPPPPKHPPVVEPQKTEPVGGPSDRVPAAGAKKGFPWRPVAISSLVVGLAGIVVGIPLLVIDGQPTCSLPNPRTSCPEVYNTVGGGAAMLSLGIAGVAASGTLFYFDHRARKKAAPRVAIVPTAGGVFVTAGGRF